MAFDIVDLQGFYGSALGQLAARGIGRIVARQWAACAGMSFAGIGYATPYLEPFRPDCLRALALMPARQGVVNWPTPGRSSAALIEPTAIPLPTASIDRVLVVHALEFSEQPGDMLEEIWRILTPGGRLMIVAPSRAGVWARVDTTPFGHGQPYSRSQLTGIVAGEPVLPDFLGRGALCAALRESPDAAHRARDRAHRRQAASAGRRRRPGRSEQAALPADHGAAGGRPPGPATRAAGPRASAAGVIAPGKITV